MQHAVSQPVGINLASSRELEYANCDGGASAIIGVYSKRSPNFVERARHRVYRLRVEGRLLL
jgi:hypothetical protein